MSGFPPLIAVALLFVVVPSAPAQQSPKLVQAIIDLKVYRARVIDYHAGQDEAVGELLKWNRKRLIAALMLIRSRYDATGPWPDATLRTASMMHTDAAIRRLDGGRWIFAVARLMRSHGRDQDAERLLERGRTRFDGLRDAFVRIVNEFRTRYLLTYTPRRV